MVNQQTRNHDCPKTKHQANLATLATKVSGLLHSCRKCCRIYVVQSKTVNSLYRKLLARSYFMQLLPEPSYWRKNKEAKNAAPYRRHCTCNIRRNSMYDRSLIVRRAFYNKKVLQLAFSPCKICTSNYCYDFRGTPDEGLLKPDTYVRKN